MSAGRGTALVAGAGVGGLAAALQLAASGYTVSVHERSAALEEFGAGLQLSPNATRILERIGALDGLRGLALEPQALIVRRARDGAELVRMELGQTARARWGAPYLVAHRADLLRALLDRVAVEPAISLNLDSTVRGFGVGEDGRLRVALKRGLLRLETQADLMIGADGLRSTVRERLGFGGPSEVRFTGDVAWRALIPAQRLPESLRRPETTLWMGPRGHLVHYPLRLGSVVNVVLVVEDSRSDALGDSGWNNPGDPSVIGFEVKDWAPEVAQLVAAASEWRGWPLFDRAPLPNWASGPVALLGDAAHPMVPYLAQGAAQAIEDSAALRDALSTREDPAAALAAYSRARAQRAGRVQTEARRQHVTYHLRGPAAFARDLAMRAMGGERLARRYDWLYGA